MKVAWLFAVTYGAPVISDIQPDIRTFLYPLSSQIFVPFYIRYPARYPYLFIPGIQPDIRNFLNQYPAGYPFLFISGIQPDIRTFLYPVSSQISVPFYIRYPARYPYLFISGIQPDIRTFLYPVWKILWQTVCQARTWDKIQGGVWFLIWETQKKVNVIVLYVPRPEQYGCTASNW